RFLALPAAPCELRRLGDVAAQTGQLRGHDQHVREHEEKDDEIGRRDVALAGAHASSSFSSLRSASRRFPSSSSRQSVAASESIAAHDTQKVANIEPAICGPREVKTVGWMKSLASR